MAAAAFAAAWMLVEPGAWRVAAERPEWILPALAGWLANQGFCALRFYVLANRAGMPLSLAQSLQMTLACFFVGCVFGGVAANDLARVVWLRQAGAIGRLSDILVLLALDRALGVLAFAAWAFALSYAVPAALAPGMELLIGTVRVLCVGFAATLAVLAMLATLLARHRRADSASWIARVAAIVGLATQARVAAGLLLAFPLAVVAAGAVIVAQGYIGAEVAGALGESPQFLVQSFLAPASIIISILPLVPLGIGLGQLTLSGLYALFGLRLETAVILTTVMQVGQFGIAAGVGAPVLALVRRAQRGDGQDRGCGREP